MSQGERPLLARDNSDHDSNRQAEEEDALLTGQPIVKARSKRQKWMETGLFIWALLATILVVVLAVVVQHEREELDKHKQKHKHKHGHKDQHGKRNMIFMVSDGMGPASLELTRTWRQYTDKLPWDDILVLDEHLIGSSRTRSSSSIVTDSAAGATAFSCGLKSYNGAISVLPGFTPCGTVMEAAKKAGYMTGLVVTTRITDATPACFASHANSRAYEDLIAEQLIGHYPLGRTVDLIVGGGRCHFLPNTTDGSCRLDHKDVVHMAKKNGYNYIDNRKDFDKLRKEGNVELPLLALLAEGDIPFEIDRRHITEQYPSELEMAKFALDTLAAATKNSTKGFFIMIEGSRIDHAGHLNDPAAQVHEVLVHDRTFAAALDFLNASDVEGVLVSTSDHETGGLSTARQLGVAYPQYLWYPSVLANASNSASHASHLWNEFLASSPNDISKTKFLTKILDENLGIVDATPEELQTFVDEIGNPYRPATYIFADIISTRAQIGWATHGHSGVDVNIYASHSEHVKKLKGNHENIEIGRFMAEYLNVDVDEITQELIDKAVRTAPKHLDGSEMEIETSVNSWGEEWMGPKPAAVEGGDYSEQKIRDGFHDGLETELR